MLGFPKCVNARDYCNRSGLETRYAIHNSSTEKAVYRGGRFAADLVVGCATVVVFVTTTTRLEFDCATTIRRPVLRPYRPTWVACCRSAWLRLACQRALMCYINVTLMTLVGRHAWFVCVVCCVSWTHFVSSCLTARRKNPRTTSSRVTSSATIDRRSLSTTAGFSPLSNEPTNQSLTHSLTTSARCSDARDAAVYVWR